jgi:hypothetical protein
MPVFPPGLRSCAGSAESNVVAADSLLICLESESKTFQLIRKELSRTTATGANA